MHFVFEPALRSYTRVMCDGEFESFVWQRPLFSPTKRGRCCAKSMDAEQAKKTHCFQEIEIDLWLPLKCKTHINKEIGPHDRVCCHEQNADGFGRRVDTVQQQQHAVAHPE